MDSQKFAADLDRTPACWTCKHKHPNAASCDAFSTIPRAILTGENQHRRPFPGDHGIRYERAEE